MGFTPLSGGASASEHVVQYRIRAVDPDNEGDAATAARLHAALFGEIGPVARLGERLLRRYCYGYVLRAGLMKAVLCEVDGQPAGLAAYTGDSVELHRAVTRSHLPFVIWETLRALAAQPQLVARLPGALRLLWERRREKLPATRGKVHEMVAFGVLPPFGWRFARLTGLRVPEMLLDYVLADARAQGFAEGRGVVLISNKPAVAFFTARASRVEPYAPAVQPSIQVWFDLTKRDSQPAR
jgi:hypothetical protein